MSQGNNKRIGLDFNNISIYATNLQQGRRDPIHGIHVMFNLSGVIALSLTGKAIEIMDYISALYLGAALTLMTVIFLVFIDPDECDRVFGRRLGDDEDENYGGLGEKPQRYGGRKAEQMSSLLEHLRSADTDFLFFSQTICPYCTRSTRTLEANHLTYRDKFGPL